MMRVEPAVFFEAIARRYDRTYALDADETRARMAKVLRVLPAKSRVLDLGVGTGRELSSLQDAGHAPTGFDVSPAMLAICARRARPLPLVLGDLWERLPFDPASFDACLALHGTIAHPTRDGAHARLAAEVARVVRSGGVFVGEVPSPALLEHLDDGPLEASDMTLQRIAIDRVLHEDRIAHVAVEAVVLDAEQWRAIFAPPAWQLEVEPLGRFELLLTARRLYEPLGHTAGSQLGESF